MIKYDLESESFKYYDENGNHKLTDDLTYDDIANIIWDLSLSFRCDMTISHALYVAVRKLQGYSDEEIKKMTGY